MKQIKALAVQREIPEIVDESEIDFDEGDTLKQVVADEMSHLEEKDRRILKERMLKGKKGREVAEEMHVTRTRIWQLEQKAHERFGRAMRRRYQEKRVPIEYLCV